MRFIRPEMSSGRKWWWLFGLLIGAPALVLAVLGLRAVRAERIEREQQLRDRQSQTARLADAGLRAAVSEIERDLRLRDSTPQNSVDQTVEHPDIQFFSFDRAGQLTFSRERVYFGDSPHRDAINWPAAIEQLVEEARGAEAQQRAGQAAALYTRIISAEPRLRDWARLSLLRLEHKDDTQFLADILNAESDGLTPSGLPVALVACAGVETLSVENRGRYQDIIERTLTQLRAGRWWLNFEERSFYDQQLRSLLANYEPSDHSGADRRLEELANIARMVGAVTLRRDEPTRYFERTEGGPTLIVLSPSQQGSTLWQGAALNQDALADLLDDVTKQAGVQQFGATRVTDETGNTIWGAPTDNSAGTYSETLSVVPGWSLAFQRGDVAHWFDPRTMLWLALIGMLIVTMLVSLAGTMRVVRREAELARLQNEFIAGVSHEFKSPITSIRLLVERMASGRFPSAESKSDYQAATERELTRLERHVNRLLEAQRIQVGQRRYNFNLTSLSDIAGDVIAELATQAESKQVRIEYNSDPDLPSLQLDRSAMTDALVNLIGNAIKYSPAGTRINVTTRLDSRRVFIDVQDEGIGIDRDDARRVFNRFYRGKSSHAQSVNGTGLGLALVKATVQAHGGNISVTSTPGKGSRFTISLPLERRNS